MFGKEEKKIMIINFWEGFKEHMKSHKSLRGTHVAWTSYPTNVKSIYFRYLVDTEKAKISIDIQDKDGGIRELHWEQFTELKKILEGFFGDQLIWEQETFSEINKPISQIYIELPNVNIFRKEDHLKIYEFLQENILKLDEFWEIYIDIFEQLQ